MAITTDKFHLKVEDVLLDHVEKRLTEEVAKEFDLKLAQLNRKKNEIISGLMIDVMKKITINSIGKEIIITLKEIKNDDNKNAQS